MPWQPDFFPPPLFEAEDVRVPEKQAELAEISDLFGPPIHVYTRRQAIEDGVLVDLCAEDSDTAGMVREAGFLVPVAMTVRAFTHTVWPLEDPAAEAWLRARGQDLRGRLWDVLWMGARFLRRDASVGFYRLSVVCHDVKPRGRRTVRLKAVMGGDDDGAPCITIMLPEED